MKHYKFVFLISVSLFMLAACGESKTPETSTPTPIVTPIPTIDPAIQIAADKKLVEDAVEKIRLKEVAKVNAAAEAKAEAEAAKLTAEAAEKEKSAMIFKEITPNIATDQVMDEITYNFIVDNSKWFPALTAEDKAAARKKVDSAITSRMLFKNAKPYLGKMVKITGTAIQVQEENTDVGTIATVHIIDDYGNSLMGIYLGSTGELLDGDSATIVGIPITPYSFDNVSGGTTLAVLLALSEVKKIQ